MNGVSTFINDDLISSNLGKTLALTWTIDKYQCQCQRQHYIILNFHSPHGRVSTWLFFASNNQTIKSDLLKKKFGDRINVTWVDRNFKVELKYLQSNDTGNFSVDYYCSSGYFLLYPSSILITETQGMYRFISKCMNYDIVCLGTLWISVHCNTTKFTATYTATYNIRRNLFRIYVLWHSTLQNFVNFFTFEHCLAFLQNNLILFQHHRLTIWKTFSKKINFRKTFTSSYKYQERNSFEKYISFKFDRNFRTQDVISIRRSIWQRGRSNK